MKSDFLELKKFFNPGCQLPQMDKFVKKQLRLEAHSLAQVCLKFKSMVVDEELSGKTWDEILDMDEEKPCQNVLQIQQAEKATFSKGNFCSICDKNFSTKKILKRHSKIHSDEKSHPCPRKNCKMSFHRKDHLNSHMVKHTEEKPFSCDSCNEKFAHKKSKDRHVNKNSCT